MENGTVGSAQKAVGPFVAVGVVGVEGEGAEVVGEGGGVFREPLRWLG